jgi:hypothetical protein
LKRIRAPCEIHGGRCCVYSNLLENSLGLRLSEAGHTCKDWSRFGKQAGAVGKSAKYFWLWCAERLAVLEDLCICECSEDFDPILFEFALASEYDVHSVILNATIFGDCVLRKRRFTVCPTCLSLAIWQSAHIVEGAELPCSAYGRCPLLVQVRLAACARPIRC